MIFLTVGSEPCDRLVQAVDAWFSGRPDCEAVLMQIADGRYQPSNCEYVRFLSPDEYRKNFERARLIVSHAGMGTIITALELNKPIIVMPRRATLGETRNEHQLATVRRFLKSEHIIVAETEKDIPGILEQAIASGLETSVNAGAVRGSTNWSPDMSLISFVRDFVS